MSEGVVDKLRLRPVEITCRGTVDRPQGGLAIVVAVGGMQPVMFGERMVRTTSDGTSRDDCDHYFYFRS